MSSLCGGPCMETLTYRDRHVVHVVLQTFNGVTYYIKCRVLKPAEFANVPKRLVRRNAYPTCLECVAKREPRCD